MMLSYCGVASREAKCLRSLPHQTAKPARQAAPCSKRSALSRLDSRDSLELGLNALRFESRSPSRALDAVDFTLDVRAVSPEFSSLRLTVE